MFAFSSGERVLASTEVSDWLFGPMAYARCDIWTHRCMTRW